MKKTLTSLAALSVFVAPAALAQGKSYNAKPFSSIEVDGAMNVIYTSGEKTSLRVEASDGDFSDLRIVNRGDALVVSRESLKGKRSWLSWGGRSINVSDDRKVVKVNGKKVPTYTVYITSPELSSVLASQASRFESTTIRADAFEAKASSDAQVLLGGTVGTADLSASSSGELKAAELAATTLKVSASSDGEADVFTSGTGETTVSASSSGDVNVISASAARFIVDASSGASVELSGSCDSIRVSASSGAGVEADGLSCSTADVNVSSGADVEVFANTSATANASSGGSASFSGKPGAQDVSESSGGSVSFAG